MTLNSPLLILAALHYKGILSHEEAEALAMLYKRPADFDHPVPVNVESAMQMVGPVFEGIEEDEAIEAMMATEGVSVVGGPAPDGMPPSWVLDAFQFWHLVTEP